MTPTTWRPARLRVAALAVAMAMATAAAAAGLGIAHLERQLAVAYVLTAVVALFSPAAIAVQVILGQVMVAVLLVGDAVDPILLFPVVAGVVATAELLAIVARLDIPLPRDPGGIVRPVGGAAVIAGVAFVAVSLLVGVPGPTGLAAVVLASGGCVALAMVLVRAESREPPRLGVELPGSDDPPIEPPPESRRVGESR